MTAESTYDFSILLFRVLDVDFLDKALVWELMANARISVQELAKKYDMSFNTIKDRISKLEKSGTISEYTIELSLEMLGAELVSMDIYTDGSENIRSFVDQIGKHPLVRLSHRVSGKLYGATAVIAGTREFFELKQFIESLDAVIKVDFHPFTWVVPEAPSKSRVRTRGCKLTFTKNQLRVLKCLLDDVRMPVTEIARRTAMTPRRVTNTLRELQDGGGVHFTLNINYVDEVELILRIRFNETTTSVNQIVDWFQEHYPLEFWGGALFLDEPVYTALIYSGPNKDLGELIRKVREASFSESVEDRLVLWDPKLKPQYRGPAHHRLEAMIKDAGL